MSLGENKNLWLGLAALAVTAIALVWMIASPEPFSLVLLYDDIGSLEKGDPVVWKTFEIGRVEKIQPLVENKIGVTVRIREEYVSSMTEGTEFILRQTSFMGMIGDNAVEAVTPGTPGKPLSNGQKIPGTVRVRASMLESSTRWTLEQIQQLRDTTSAMLEELRSSPLREEADGALRELRRLVEEGAHQSKEGFDRFRRDHQKELDETLRKLGRLRDEMRKQGHESAARQIERELETMTRR